MSKRTLFTGGTALKKNNPVYGGDFTEEKGPCTTGGFHLKQRGICNGGVSHAPKTRMIKYACTAQ